VSEWYEPEGLPQEEPAEDNGDRAAPRPPPVGRVVILTSLGVLAGFVLLAWLRGDVLAQMGHAPAMRYAGMYFTANVMVAGVMAGFAFLVSWGSRAAARWTYCIVLGLGLAGQVNSVEHFAADLRSKARHDAAVAQSAVAFERIVAGDVAGSKALDDLADTWEGVAQSGRGERAASSRASAQFLRERHALLVEYERALAAWLALCDARLNDEHDLAARTKGLDQLEQATRSMTEAQAGESKRFEELLARAGIPSSARTDYLASFIVSAPFKAEVWRQRSRFIDTQRHLLQVLREHAGKWEAGAEDGTVFFHDAAADELFQAALVRTSEVSNAVSEAERRFREHARALLGKAKR